MILNKVVFFKRKETTPHIGKRYPAPSWHFHSELILLAYLEGETWPGWHTSLELALWVGAQEGA